MLGHCWLNVHDTGSTLTQQWVERLPSKHEMWPNVGSLLAHGPQRRPNSKPALGQRPM